MDNGFHPTVQSQKWGRNHLMGNTPADYAAHMKIRPDWREQLRKLVAGQELAPISRRAKLNPTYLRDVLERNQTPQLKSAEKLSDALGVTITDWFLLVEPVNKPVPSREPKENQELALRIDQMPRDFPVFGSAQCGDDGSFEFNAGEAIDFVRRPPRLQGIKDAYALYVTGASMRPWREEGQLVYVHPRQPVQIGDYVVVQVKSARDGDAPLAYIKRLERRTAREITLSQYNPHKSIVFSMAKVISIHRIVDWTELLGI